MNASHRVSLSFRRLPDSSLSVFAGTVLANFYAQAMSDEPPPVTEAELGARMEAFKLAKVAQAQDGMLGTVVKNQCRKELMDSLRKLACYVQVYCHNDLAKLLSSGFQAMSRNRATVPLPKAGVLRIRQSHSGVALVTVKPDRNAWSYELMAAEVDEHGVVGAYLHHALHTSSLNIPLEGLKPGKVFAFRVRIHGGRKTVSDWSDVVMQRVL